MVAAPASSLPVALTGGNAMDWDQIVRENAREMLRLAMRIVGSSADAEELVQEAFLKAYQYRQREEVRNWGGLLHRFVFNGALDHLRTRKTTVSLPETGLASSADDPARLAEVRELADRLRGEIAKLPSQQSEVFCLCHFAGRSNHQIADVLGIQEGAVATALHKARERLRAAMARFLRKAET
jgi:RNA polymerase sigma-70 factor, ECF subfamily